MAKQAFSSVFRVHPNGGIEPMQRVRIGGVEFGPGVIFGPGVSFGGIDLSQYANKDLEVEVQGTNLLIKGVYSI